MTRSLGELLIGFGLAGWGITFYLLALKFTQPLNPFDAGPGMFPRLISGVLIILGLLLCGQSLRKFKSSNKIVFKRQWNILATVILLILYALALPRAGYYFSTAVFFPAMLLLAGERKWISIVATAGIFLLFAFGAFDLLLNVPMPSPENKIFMF